MKAVLFVLTFISSIGFARVNYLDKWKKAEDKQQEIYLNPLRFTTRAQCAIDSKSATKSAFMMLDSVSPGKSFFRLAKATGQDTDYHTLKGIEKYRYTATELSRYVATRLLHGKIPLLDKNTQEYRDCLSGNCEGLESLIEGYWTLGDQSLKVNKSQYINAPNAKVGCYYIKEFSPIQGHLFSSFPSPKTATRIGQTVSDFDKYMVECSDLKAQENLKVSNYQLDILNVPYYTWSQVGFRFWNSFKIYLSWAFRNSLEAEQMAMPYASVMKSIALEESLLLIPNGCKSITEPKCDSETINLNSMRAFTQLSEQQVFHSDFSSQIPRGQEEELLDNPVVSVNEDILGLAKQKDASSWAQRFRDRFTKTRGMIKLKFINAVNRLKLISNNLPLDLLSKELERTVLLGKENDALKTELYYLCSEFKVATDKDFSFLLEELNLLSKAENLNRFSKTIGGQEVKHYFNYFKNVSNEVKRVCDNMAKAQYWDGGFAVDRSGFTSWYKEHTQDKKQPFKTNIIRELSKNVKTPILAYGKDKKNIRPSEIICVEGANCSRIVLESIFDLYASLKYTEALMPAKNIQDSSFFNPVSERNACNIYDPFRKKRAVIYQFFYDILRAAFFGIVPTPIYISTEVKDKQVVSFKKLMEDGKVTFDPQYDKAKIKNALVADLGVVFGIPCAIAISGSTANPVKYYRYNGVSVGGCSETTVNNLVVRSSNEMSNGKDDGSKCASCAINLETVVGAVASMEPITRSAFILIKGVYRLYKGLRDPYDIPRRWELDLNDTHQTYLKYGHINSFCLTRLLRGKPCLANDCEGAMVRGARKLLNGNIEESFVGKYRGNGFLKLSTCDELIEVKTSYNRRRICKRNQISMNDFIIPPSCNISKESK